MSKMLTAAEAIAALTAIEVEKQTAARRESLIADVVVPEQPAEGTVVLRDKSGRVLALWTKEQWADEERAIAQYRRAKDQYEKDDREGLESLRFACRSLARIKSHDVPTEFVASAAAAFGRDAGLPILLEYVERTCPPDYDAAFIAGDLWCEACMQIADTFEELEEARHEPGGWRWLIEQVRELDGTPPPSPPATTAPLGGDDVQLVRASDVKLKKYDWLWKDNLIRGKLHVVAGAPSGGKTTLMLDLCATVSKGGKWPDGTQAKPGKVLIWSSEDDIDDTLAPRLKAMGADLGNIHFVRSIKDAITGSYRPFDPATDLAALRRKVQHSGDVALILVDPIVSAVSGDSHKNAEVRRGLQPLVDLAQECGAALIGISHFTKGTAGRDPVERVTGSLAFGALARIVFAVAKHVDEDSGEEERIFVRAKSNIGPSDGGFKFSIGQTHLPAPDDMDASTVTWGDALEGSARDLLKEAEGAAGESSKSEDAAEVIQETIRIKGGEAAANALHEAMKAAGIGKHNRYKAMKELSEKNRIVRVRYTETGPWHYRFPIRVADPTAFDPPASDADANGDLV